MAFFRINTIIGLILSVLIYGVLLLFIVPVIVDECKEDHKSFKDYCNEELKPIYEFKNNQSTIVWILIMIGALLEAIFLWELHYPFVVWLIVKQAKEEGKNNETTNDN